MTSLSSSYRRARSSTVRALRGCAVVGVLALVATACGDDAPATRQLTRAAPASTATDGATDAETGGSSASGAVTSVDDVSSATIQIIAEGTFRDPEIGQVQGAGSGSGFIIDSEGIAVTNNHVVTGAASLNVFVGGSTDPVNATVLGVSECSDLAVIDLAGDGYPFLEWHEGPIDARLDVFSAGYPLGAPEFTLTDGIVNVADRDIETEWASVENVVEHSARIRPGNSGGPLVTEAGQVVGINYAGQSEDDFNFAINVTEARTIVEQLRDGEDVTSIGVNGIAVLDDEGSSGVWVASVDSGSPASTAGLTGGDIIIGLEGVTIGSDGTMADYCDILRSHSPEDVLAIEVLRFDTEEILEGEINGTELAQSFSFAQEFEDTMDMDSAPSDATYASYTTVTDDTGAIAVEVPAEWADVNGTPFTDDQGRQIFDVTASSSLDSFFSSWETPGMSVSASSALAQSGNELTLLDELVPGLSEQCDYAGRQPYEDPAYTGQFDLYTNCGGVGATYVVVGAVPADRTFVIRVQIQANSDRDFEALDRILNSFVVIGAV